MRAARLARAAGESERARPSPGIDTAQRTASYAPGVELTVGLRRWGYRAAYLGLRGYWFIARPETHGVKCVLTDGDGVLLVRHTYGSRAWDLPGGGGKGGEALDATARREIKEELGIDIADWRPLGQIQVAIDHRRDVVHCFQAEVHAPALRIDRGELSDARWFKRSELPAVGPYTRRILALI